MGRRRNGNNDEFWDSAIMNNLSFMQNFDRLAQIAQTSFEYEGVPDTIDLRFLESTLFWKNNICFFEDEVLGYLALPSNNSSQWTVYNIPKRRDIYATNGYKNVRTNKDSVIIYDNVLHRQTNFDLKVFAMRLYNIERAIDVNVSTQKTPYIITAPENMKFSIKQILQKIMGFQRVINTYKGVLDVEECIKKIDLTTPYIADKLYQLKTDIWNEALTYLGVPNVSISKRERMIGDEVNKLQGGTIASRNGRLLARQQAVKEINKMFGLDIKVKWRDDIDTSLPENVDEQGVGYNE